jgi:hypothetical protein
MKFTRRIFLALTMALVSVNCFAADAEQGFNPLFNGKDLKGWEGNPELWSVKDGLVIGKTTAEKPIKGNTFLIWRDGTVDDFVIRFSYKIIGGNSGLQYRSKQIGTNDWIVGGYQGDFEAGTTYSGILYEERGPRGIMAERGQKVFVEEGGKKMVVGKVGDSAEIQASIKKEDWNDYEITAKGNHFIHTINGKTTVDVTDNDTKNFAASGILAFQLHAGPPMEVQFKDVRIKRLPVDSKKK